MPLKLYTDSHIARQVTEQLRKKGVDIIHCEEVDMSTASDEEHLIFATQQGRTMVSVDRHFPALHTRWLEQGKAHMGIIRVLPEIQGNIGRMVKELLDYHEMIEGGAGTVETDIQNQLIFIG